MKGKKKKKKKEIKVTLMKFPKTDLAYMETLASANKTALHLQTISIPHSLRPGHRLPATDPPEVEYTTSPPALPALMKAR